MDVARLNFSHGDHADHEALYKRVRAAADVTGRAVGILADLQGPKIRLGRFADGPTYWATGETVRITVDDCEGTHDRVSTTYKQLADDAAPGDRLLVDDGKVGLVVEHVDGNDVVCTVTEGGPVSNNKGLSLPGMNVSVPAMSEKDIDDLEFALRLGVDLVALSFVRSPADVELVHEVMDRVGRRVPVIAKLEKPEASTTSRPSCWPSTRSWSPAVTSASSCRSRRCRWCRSGPSRWQGRTPNRSSSPPRCWSR